MTFYGQIVPCFMIMALLSYVQGSSLFHKFVIFHIKNYQTATKQGDVLIACCNMKLCKENFLTIQDHDYSNKNTSQKRTEKSTRDTAVTCHGWCG